MGGQESKIATGGSLQGVAYPDIAQVPEENLPSLGRSQAYTVKVPQSVVRPSNGTLTMGCVTHGVRKIIKIPKGLKGGETFTFTQIKSEAHKVFTSTLPSVPGMDIVQSKPIIWGSISYSFYRGSSNQQAMGNMVGKLMQDAQAKIVEQVIQHRCNACLGMSFNVTNDSSGDRGNQKLVIITAQGTPCVIVPTTTARAVGASTMAEPVYS